MTHTHTHTHTTHKHKFTHALTPIRYSHSHSDARAHTTHTPLTHALIPTLAHIPHPMHIPLPSPCTPPLPPIAIAKATILTLMSAISIEGSDQGQWQPSGRMPSPSPLMVRATPFASSTVGRRFWWQAFEAIATPPSSCSSTRQRSTIRTT